MNDNLSIPRIPMQLSRDCLVASIQVDLDEQVLSRFREDLLGEVHRTAPQGVIFDVSGLEVIDSEDFEALRRTMAMVALMGSRPVISGLAAGVVSSLMDLDVDVSNVEATRDLDDAFVLLLESDRPSTDDSFELPELSDEATESVDDQG